MCAGTWRHVRENLRVVESTRRRHHHHRNHSRSSNSSSDILEEQISKQLSYWPLAQKKKLKERTHLRLHEEK